MGCLGGLAHDFKTMYNKTMDCSGGLAHGFKTMCTTNIFVADNSIFYSLKKKHYNISPIHGFKTMCKALLKPWVVYDALHMVIKPFGRPS